jgi:2-polyprenyl-6-methoxyphenol hydroxylase-like FAD-dependent oxidoreductase
MKEMTKKADGMMQENMINRADEARIQDYPDVEPSSHHTVLIAGGGVGGLTLANDLALRGVPFRVIDPLPEPVRDSRAHGFGARTLLALDKLGLVESMLAAAKQPPPVLREYFGRTLVGELDLGAVPRDPYPAMLAIFQQRVVRVLEAALIERGHRVEWSTRLMSFEMDEKGVVATVDRGGSVETIKARWIVGADGSMSVVRKTLGLDDPNAVKASGEASRSLLRGLLCECDADWKLSRDVWWLWQERDGFAGAEYNDFTNKWHLQVIDLEGTQATLERMEVLLRKRSGIHTVHLSNPAWVHQATFSQHAATRFLAGRGALLGDAAHTFSSVAGQGLHFAIEDALNLGWKLALTIAGAASPSLLQTYETERRERFDNAIEKTRWTKRFLTLHGMAAKVFWALLYFMGRRFRSISSIALKQAEKLDMNYPRSPLSRQDSTQMTPHTRAGMHAPDAPCRIGGRPSRLLEILRGPKADLLLFAGLSPTPEAIRALQVLEESVASLQEHVRVRYVFPSQAYASDAGMSVDDPQVIVDGLEKLHAVFGMERPEIVYVRPDGYIGLRTENLDARSLSYYFKLIYAVAGR